VDILFEGWRPLLRRQWPTIVSLALLLMAEAVAYSWYEGGRGVLWLLVPPPSLLLCVFAVAATYQPVFAALAGAATIVATSAMLQVLDTTMPTLFSPVSPAQTAAVMVLIAVLVRQAPRRKAVLCMVALAFAGVFVTLMQIKHGDWNPFRKNEGFAALMLVALSIGTGMYFRARDVDREHLITGAVSAAQQSERIALARELHDVVAHHVTGIIVQAQAALTVADKDPLAAHRLLPGIATSGTEALTAMRRLVGTLRDQDSMESATTDLASDVHATIEQSRQLGVSIDAHVDLPSSIPPEVARSVLRILQEALTNAHKHAVTATLIKVQVFGAEQRVRIVVVDDGQEPARAPVGGSGGYGLLGMRERVELLGGLFSAGPTGSRGWQVLAELPMGKVGA
jgi:signal transduction histidine kinase